MIPESFIQDLLDRIDIVDVIGRYVTLKRGGANLLGLCPFHNEKTPSFTVSAQKQFYHCFGCGAHGNAIGFVMQHSGLSYPEAIQNLAASIGMKVPQEDMSPQKKAAYAQKKQIKQTLSAVLETVQKHYLQLLRQSPEVIQYLKDRGLTGETAKKFGIGWSGHIRNDIEPLFSPQDISLLIESGILLESEDGQRYNRFRERVMFPIRNMKGELIAFGGRVIVKAEPKYLNSPETPIFEKRQELYGLWENRQGIHREKRVLVVEGYMDVVGLAEHGIDFAVATLGTATSELHLQKLMRLSHQIIFCFDGDAAGQRAAWRALELCLPLLREDVVFRFLFLPEEHDPDSYIKAFGESAFRQALDKAMALSAFFKSRLSTQFNLSEAEGRLACLHEAKNLLIKIKNPIILAQFKREFAPLVQLTDEELSQSLAQVTQKQALNVNRKAQLSASTPVYQRPDTRKSTPKPYQAYASAVNITPVPKQLMRYLVQYPPFASQFSEYELDILDKDPNMHWVSSLVVLIQTQSIKHMGGLLQAIHSSEIPEELVTLVSQLSVEPSLFPEALESNEEWQQESITYIREALRKAELVYLMQYVQSLADKGKLMSEEEKQIYSKLNLRIRQLKN